MKHIVPALYLVAKFSNDYDGDGGDDGGLEKVGLPNLAAQR